MSLRTAPSNEEIARLFHEGMLGPELAHRFEREEDEDEDLLARCVALHNQGAIDLVGVPSQPSFKQLESTIFFTAQHFFCRAIPCLKTSAVALMECCRILVEKAGTDGVANEPNRAFQSWCVKNPTERDTVIRDARAGDQLAMHFVTFALRASGDAEIAIDFVKTYSDERQFFGIAGLGGMTFADDPTVGRSIEAVQPLLDSHSDDRLRANALVGAFEILGRSPNSEKAEELLNLAVNLPGDELLHALARVLWSHRSFLTLASIELILRALQSVNPKHVGTLGTIDLALRPLLGGSNETSVQDYLTEVLKSGELSLESFSSIAHELSHGDHLRLYEWCVHWLLSGNVELCKCVAKLTGASSGKPFEAIRVSKKLNTVRQIFLCRKAIGFLFSKPVLCSSILVSVLRGGDKDAAEQAEKLLFDPLLVNYGGGVKDYLASISVTDDAYVYVKSALSKYEAFYSGLRAAGTINEIHPSEYQHDVVRQRDQDIMGKAYKQAQSKSVFLSLVHRSTVLYGKRTLTFVTDPEGKQRAVAMDLKQMSTMFEMPRQEISDPIGLEVMTLTFRVEKLK